MLKLFFMIAAVHVRIIHNSVIEASDDEIKKLSEKLWCLDSNNRVSECDLNINEEFGKPFIGNIPSAYLEKNTYKTFIALLDNYIPWTGTAEPYCPLCIDEQNKFIDAIMETDVMKLAWEFLRNKSLANDSLELFKKELSTIWFHPYVRTHVVNGSSAFEHVFSGEHRGTKVTGLHNWIRLYLLEKSGKAKFIKHIKHCPPNRESISLEWGIFKDKSVSMFLGSSPEFEMAIYTVCDRVRKNNVCKLRLKREKVYVHTWSMKSKKQPVDTIGTAFPYCP